MTSGNETRVALVTGASRGIGRASAIALAEAGLDVAVTARSVEGGLEETVEAVRATGRRAHALPLDLSNVATIDSAVDAALAEFGCIDVLMNNAFQLGPASNALFLETDAEELETTLSANVLSPMRLCQRVLPGMIERKGGVIINVISGGALGEPTAPANRGGWSYSYASQKAAFHKLTGILHIEHKRDGVAAFSLQPGVVLTEMLIEAFGDALEAAKERYAMVEPEVPGAATAWLATADAAVDYSGQAVFATRLCREYGLVPASMLPEGDD
ncbi:MAG: SDR family oxidoreductase [Myxococcota bacterium]|nr:SDR family oxidoreductase [Myxococcota bacterium]